MTNSRPTHPRKGREGKGVGKEWRTSIHALRLTSAPTRPVDNSRAAVGRCMDGSLRDQIGGV